MKTLERITVNWHDATSTKDIINVVIYNNEEYCIDDIYDENDISPIGSSRKRVIAEVNTLADLYREYVKNIVRAPLNPYALLKLHKEGHILTRFLPLEIKQVLDNVRDKIPDEVIEALNKHIMHYKITAIEIHVLEAVAKLLKLADQKTVLDSIIEYLEVWLGEKGGAYPDNETMYAGVSFLLEAKERDRDREKDRDRDRIAIAEHAIPTAGQVIQDSVVSIGADTDTDTGIDTETDIDSRDSKDKDITTQTLQHQHQHHQEAPPTRRHRTVITIEGSKEIAHIIAKIEVLLREAGVRYTITVE